MKQMRKRFFLKEEILNKNLFRIGDKIIKLSYDSKNAAFDGNDGGQTASPGI